MAPRRKSSVFRCIKSVSQILQGCVSCASCHSCLLMCWLFSLHLQRSCLQTPGSATFAFTFHAIPLRTPRCLATSSNPHPGILPPLFSGAQEIAALLCNPSSLGFLSFPPYSLGLPPVCPKTNLCILCRPDTQCPPRLQQPFKPLHTCSYADVSSRAQQVRNLH